MQIELLNASFTYATPGALRTDTPKSACLGDLTLRLSAGECALLLGATGAGKSTLLHLLAGVLEPSSGVRRLEGAEDDAMGVGLVLQHPERQLFCSTVFDEVAFGLKRLMNRGNWWQRRRGITRVAERVGVDTRVGAALEAVGLAPELYGPRHPLRLSGGEKRRLAIACILVLEPRFLLLDEPFAGLDAPGQRAMYRLIEDAKGRGAGVMIATHHIEPVAALADRAMLLHGGRVVVDGPASEVLADTMTLRAAGLEPLPLAVAGEELRARGWAVGDWSSPRALAESLFAVREIRWASAAETVGQRVR